MPGYWLNDREVKIAWHADVPRECRPDGQWATYVQTVLNGIEDWDPQVEDPIETVVFTDIAQRIFPMAVEVAPNERVTWGIHAGHKAQNRGLSPFVRKFVPSNKCKAITVELVGSPEKPLLVRAYGGEYTPPLPWMQSAENADGGHEACVEYWQSHAYCTRDGDRIIVPGSQTVFAPKWYTAR